MKPSMVVLFSSLLVIGGCTQPTPRGGPMSYPDHGAATTKGAGARVQTGGRPHMDATLLPAEPNTPPMTDTQFIRQAAQLGIAEVRMGELAVQNASESAVRDYAEHLVRDHSKANQELAALAARKGVDLPLEVSSQHHSAIQRLSMARPGEFDRLFQRYALETHRQALHAFRMAAQTSTDSDIRAFALKQLPSLEQHMAHAQRMEAGSAIGGSAGTDF